MVCSCLLYTSQVLEDFDHSVEECRILQSGYQSMLSIGMLDSHDPEKFARPQIRNFMRHKPDVYLSIHSNPVEAIRSEVLTGHLDLGYTVSVSYTHLGYW